MAAKEVGIYPYRDNKKEAAIIFIHGFSGKRKKTWGDFPVFLSKDNKLKDWDIFSIGYSTSLAPNIFGFWSGDPDITRLSKLLLTQLQHTQLRDYKAFVFIAHSMGGLVLQKALIDGATILNRINHVFLFGTPSSGLEIASFLRFLNPQVRDMAKDSEFIIGLREKWSHKWGGLTRPAFKFIPIAGDRDEFVPPKSSLEPFPEEYRAVVNGNHLEIVKPETPDTLSVQLVIKSIMGEAAPAGPMNSACVAVELGLFKEAIDRFRDHVAELDQHALVQYALALEQTGQQAQAIEILQTYSKNRTDPMGVLAGRLKRRWILEHREGDAQKAMELYKNAYDIAKKDNNFSQCYYHGINIAFMELAYRNNLNVAREKAKEVLDYCNRAEVIPREKKWKLATMGEAHLYLGNIDKSLEYYKTALETSPTPSPRECDSMYKQAVWICDFLGEKNTMKEFKKIFEEEGEYNE